MSDCDKECKYFPVSMKYSRAALALSHSIAVISALELSNFNLRIHLYVW